MQSAELLVFPVDRRGDLVARTARDLNALHGQAADAFWRTTARKVYRDLLAQGHDDATARVEVMRFSDSVQMALRDGVTPVLSLVTA